jgi:hypothetical protein
MFPFAERPKEPGPMQHIGYCVGELRRPTGRAAVVVVYTTTSPIPAGQAKPRGVITVSQTNAAEAGQRRAFLIDGRRIAFLRVEDAFFPHLNRPDRGVVARAPRRRHNAVMRMLADLFDEPALIELLGPERPATGIGRGGRSEPP